MFEFEAKLQHSYFFYLSFVFVALAVLDPSQLVSVDPLVAGRDDPRVRGRVVHIGVQLELAVHRLEVVLALARPVANHHLRRVLVGHHHGGLRKQGTRRARSVGAQGLRGHAAVVVALQAVHMTASR